MLFFVKIIMIERFKIFWLDFNFTDFDKNCEIHKK